MPVQDQVVVMAKRALLWALPTVLIRTPRMALQPQRLYYLMHALQERAEVPGAVLEVGCWLGGTAATIDRFLRNVGTPRRYVCVDTFSGFVSDQFDRDTGHGTPGRLREMFTANSPETVRRLLDYWGATGVELVQGDIATIDPDRLPDQICTCLLDVDLELPIYEGLTRITPRVVPGGIVLVDDCEAAGTDWVGARLGYARYCADAGIPERYEYGFGVVTA